LKPRLAALAKLAVSVSIVAYLIFDVQRSDPETFTRLVAEPKDWTLTFVDAEAPQTGRACLLSTPYSGQPTRFDDIVVAVEK